MPWQQQQQQMPMSPPFISWNPWISQAMMSAQLASSMMMTVPPPVQLGLQTPQVPLQPTPLRSTSPSVRPDINSGNTTIIGDAVISVFTTLNGPWLVQMVGNLTIQVLAQLLVDGKMIPKKYNFIAVGSNQLYSASDSDIRKYYNRILTVILDKVPKAKIYFIPVLPRPLDNDDVKAFVVDYNRHLSNTVKGMVRSGMSVRYLAIQNEFLFNGKPDGRYFAEGTQHLNEEGARRFRTLVFEAAGFKKNS